MSDNSDKNLTTKKLGQLTSNDSVVTDIKASNIQFPFHEWHITDSTAVVDVQNFTVNEIACITTEVYGVETISHFEIKINIPTSKQTNTDFVEFYVNVSPINGAYVDLEFNVNNIAITAISQQIHKPMAFHFYESNGEFKVYNEENVYN